eukprot:jgi/Chrzof1/6185/Cz17g14200.t1
MESSRINDNGERVVGGTVRPDGTIRKERRVRAGYIPQDEQPVYMSMGATFKQSIPKCPGYDPSADAAQPAKPKSKTAKKNEKRKQKKAEHETDSHDGQVAAVTHHLQSLRTADVAVSPTPPVAASATTNTPPAAPNALANGASNSSSSTSTSTAAAVIDKQIKALSKKVRQCEALLQRQAAGEKLSPQEQEKLDKMKSWQEETRQLEHQLAKLVS